MSNDPYKDDNQFRTGEEVTEEAEYICVPCGYKEHLEPGQIFPQCVSCLNEEEREEMAEGLELWEKVNEPIEDAAA